MINRVDQITRGNDDNTLEIPTTKLGLKHMFIVWLYVRYMFIVCLYVYNLFQSGAMINC